MFILFLSGLDRSDPVERVSVPCIEYLTKLGHEVIPIGPNDRLKVEDSYDFRSKADLIICLEDVVPQRMDMFTCPKVFWGLETMHHHEQHYHRSQPFDFTFLTHEMYVNEFRGRGRKNTFYLPYAASQNLLKYAQPKDKDIVFVGKDCRDYYALRMLHLDYLKEHVSVYHHPHCGFNEYVTNLSRGHMNWNFDVYNHMGERTFEGVLFGFHITNLVETMPNLFREGEHLVWYHNKEDMVEKVKKYTNDKELRDRIATAGRKEILEKHTYDKRMEDLLRIIGVKT